MPDMVPGECRHVASRRADGGVRPSSVYQSVQVVDVAGSLASLLAKEGDEMAGDHFGIGPHGDVSMTVQYLDATALQCGVRHFSRATGPSVAFAPDEHEDWRLDGTVGLGPKQRLLAGAELARERVRELRVALEVR